MKKKVKAAILAALQIASGATMNNEKFFLSALHESPNDEVTWSALADWLEENGQSDRAELVRIVRRLRSHPLMKRTKPRVALEERVTELLASGVRPVVPELSNFLGMRFALIPPGRFGMGSPESEKDHGANEPHHEVEIIQPFYLSPFLVTQRQYESVMRKNPSWYSRTGKGKDSVATISDEELGTFPVENVSWDDAHSFTERLNRRAESRKNRLTYRLPTESEWEYACRGGATSTTPFHFGPSLSSTQANIGEYPYGNVPSGPVLSRPCAVGSYRPNAFGLYDMHGNVSEWCGDEITWGTIRVWANEPKSGPARVYRGGCYQSCGANCRSAYRRGNSPDHRIRSIGFRIVLIPASRQ